MNLYRRLQRKFNYLADDRYIKKQSRHLLEEIKANLDKTLYFFSVPMHSNLGDQAQYFCWLQLFKRDLPDFRIISVPACVGTDEVLAAIKEKATDKDMFVVHSGYLIFDPHPELPFICKVVDMFHDHPITILPQTINLVSERKKKEVCDCFNAHPNLTVISRDKISLQNANVLFPECSRLLWPDVVTSLIGNPDFQHDDVRREGILFCIRHDGEKYYAEEQIEELKKRFGGIRVVEDDTTITLPQRYWEKRREKLIHRVIAHFEEFQLVVTDRHHGTIFSQVANTPVIVLGSTDHKLSSGVKWFSEAKLDENVFFAHDLNECYSLAKRVLEKKKKIIKNPPYFMEKFYSVMNVQKQCI